MVNDATFFAPRSRWMGVQAALLAGVIAAVVCLAGPKLGLGEYDWIAGAGVVLGAAALGAMVLGPSPIMLSVFLVFMVTAHQYRSFFTVPLGGIEWHPREFVLALLLAHWAARAVLGKLVIRRDYMHLFFYLYCFFFALIAARGAMRHDLQAVIAECRFPVFLLSYFVFVSLIRDRRELRYYIRLLFALATGIALAGIAFFSYTLITGNVISVQNELGEYVQRQIGPFLLQSVRPNGHMFFEMGVVMLTSMLFCREISRQRRAVFALVIGVFLFAILITMMRTAYVALFFSLAVLAVLAMPKEVRALSAVFAVVGAAVLMAALGMGLHHAAAGAIPGLDVSVQGRLVEIQGGIRLFAREPLLGTGMGSTFMGLNLVSKTIQFTVAQAEYQSVHNVWVYYLFKGGLVGMAFVLLGLGGMGLRAHKIMESASNAVERCFLRGLLAAFLGQLLASLAMPRLTYPMGGVFLGMVACTFVIMAGGAANRERPTGQAPAGEDASHPITPKPASAGPHRSP